MSLPAWVSVGTAWLKWVPLRPSPRRAGDAPGVCGGVGRAQDLYAEGVEGARGVLGAASFPGDGRRYSGVSRGLSVTRRR